MISGSLAHSLFIRLLVRKNPKAIRRAILHLYVPLEPVGTLSRSLFTHLILRLTTQLIARHALEKYGKISPRLVSVYPTLGWNSVD